MLQLHQSIGIAGACISFISIILLVVDIVIKRKRSEIIAFPCLISLGVSVASCILFIVIAIIVIECKIEFPCSVEGFVQTFCKTE